MNGRQFEWDAEKAESNRRKHGVTFDEATTVFDDPNGDVEYDEGHSDEEDRWRIVGLSSRLRLLRVTYTRRNEAYRIISAQRATKAEERRYTDAG